MRNILDVMKRRDSRLSIGIDPPFNLENKLEYAQKIIESTHEYALCYKPNIQFWLGAGRDELVELNNIIHKFGVPSIADIKVSDIGNTNKNSIQNLASFGFDYLTHSPFPGNLRETSEFAKESDIGLITLVVMSNPEAKWMVETGKYREWAQQSEKYSEGIVLGTTNHVTPKILQEIAKIYTEKFILAPGIGSQDGKVEDLKEIFGNRVVFNVSRGIGLSEDPRSSAKNYYELTK